MAQHGWIKLYRQITECEIWLDDEPFSKRDAWVDLLLMANREKKTMLIGGKPLEVLPGQRIIGQASLAARWHWGIGRVRRYLDLLQELGMITWKAERRWTVITVLKYGIYQLSNDESGTITERQRNADGTETEPNNKIKEYKENKENNNAAIGPQLSTELKTIVDNYQLHLKRLVTGPILTDLKELLELYGEFAVCTAIQKAKKAKTANMNYIRVTAEGVANGNDFDNKPRRRPQNNSAEETFKEIMKEENWDDYGFN